MVPLAKILENVRVWIEDLSIDNDFITFVNLAIRQVEKRVNWGGLFGGDYPVTIGSDGILLIPAQARKVTHIVSAASSNNVPLYEFMFREDQPTSESGHIRQYTANPYKCVETALASSVTVNVTQGSLTITAAAGSFLSTWVGERLLLGSSPNFYEVMSVNTGANPQELVLSGPAQQDTGIYPILVRPVGMERYLLKTNTEAIFAGDVIVRYQKKHPEVKETTDWIMMPCDQTISLLVLQNALITDKYSVDAERLERALMMAQNDEIDGHQFRKSKSSIKDPLFSVRTRRSGRSISNR